MAKMLFNMNSVWYSQWYHLAATHELADIVYLSAVRSLSDEHDEHGELLVSDMIFKVYLTDMMDGALHTIPPRPYHLLARNF